MDNNFFFIPAVDIVMFSIALLTVVLLLLVVFFFSLWQQRRAVVPSPYSEHPLRPAISLSIDSMEKVLRFLYNLHDIVDNPLIDFTEAVFCRDTGRIFPKAFDFFGNMRVDWSFINKRAPGNYVSWGSLTEEEKLIISSYHESMEGFQTESSCPDPDPAKVTREYAYTVPGPLYVDLKNKVLMGWMEVAGTDLEVLVIQKPTKSGKYML